MSHSQYTSLLDLTLSDALTYVDEVLDEHPGGDKQKIFAYLSSLVASDREAIRQQQRRVARISSRLETRLREFNMDFAPSLFTKNNGGRWLLMSPLLAVSGAHIRSESGLAATADMVITGDNIVFDGISGGGSAVAGTLSPGTTLTGKLVITGNNITIRGVKFLNTSAEMTISFAGPSSNLKLIDCEFVGNDGSYANSQKSKFWMGANYSGDALIQNCKISDHKSWMLLDLTTTSSTPTTAIGKCELIDNYWLNNAGSIAVRGLLADPTAQFTCTGNKFEYGSNQHDYFWSVIEANNLIRATVKNNTASGAIIGANERGFFQCWSRSPVDWTLDMTNNTLTNFDYALQCACVATFYSPDYRDDRYDVTAVTGKYTNVTKGASFTYPWDGTGVSYAPENLAAHPSVPTTVYPDGHTVVS